MYLLLCVLSWFFFPHLLDLNCLLFVLIYSKIENVPQKYRSCVFFRCKFNGPNLWLFNCCMQFLRIWLLIGWISRAIFDRKMVVCGCSYYMYIFFICSCCVCLFVFYLVIYYQKSSSLVFKIRSVKMLHGSFHIIYWLLQFGCVFSGLNI